MSHTNTTHFGDDNMAAKSPALAHADAQYGVSSRFYLLGRLAQLVEHLVYTERVIGSSPLPPTK